MSDVLCFDTVQPSNNPGSDMKNYTDVLFAGCTDGFVEIRQISSQRIVTKKWIPLTDLKLPTFPDDQHIYLGVATRKSEYEKGGKANISEIPAVWVDVDFKDIGREEVDRRIAEFPLPPSIIVNSGNGYHLYWRQGTPAKMVDIPKIEDVNRRLAFHFGGDQGSVDAAHLLRLPGTYNIKEHPKLVTVERIEKDLVYDLNAFSFLPLPPSSSLPAATGNSPSPFTQLLDGVDEGRRNTTVVSLAGHFREKGLPEDETKRLLDLWNQKNRPPLEEKELTDAVKYNYEHYGRNKTRHGAGDLYTSADYGRIIEASAMSLDELIKREFPSRPTIIQPWLKVGEIGMIYAQRGVGKTWLSLLIALAATRSLQIGKWQTGTPTGCLVVDGEMAAENLRHRLMDLNMGQPKEVAPFKLLCADDIRCSGMEAPNLIKESWRTALLGYLVNHQDIRLLVIDNLASLTPGLDENLKKDWDSINQWLLDLRAIGMAVIIIHHTGKGGDQRGTSAREDALDFSIRLHRDEGHQPLDGTKFVVEFTKARRIYGEYIKPFTLYLHHVDHRLIWDVTDEEPTKAELIKTLLDEGRLKQKEIAKEVGVSGQYVTNVKQKAQEEERARRMSLVFGDDEDQAEDSPQTEEVETVE